MSRIPVSRSSARVLLSALAMATFALQTPASAAAAAHELLPDLRMEVPTQLTLERGEGHYWLRFSAMISNLGEGPLEVRSTRRCPDCSHMRVSQAVLRSDGTFAVRATGTRQRFDNSDGHNHWHVMGMERYELFPMDAPFASGPLTGHKRGFCFFDGYVRDRGLPNFNPSPLYSYFGCGTPSSQTLLVGLSVGWGDLYPYDFAGQYVDLAGVAPGDYLVCLTADPSNWFRETRNSNNSAWAKVHIPAASDLPDNQRTPITAIADSRHSCQKQLPYAAATAKAGRGAASPSAAGRTSAVVGATSAASAHRTAARPAAMVGGSAGTLVWVPSVDAPESARFYGWQAARLDCAIGGRAPGTG